MDELNLRNVAGRVAYHLANGYVFMRVLDEEPVGHEEPVSYRLSPFFAAKRLGAIDRYAVDPRVFALVGRARQYQEDLAQDVAGSVKIALELDSIPQSGAPADPLWFRIPFERLWVDAGDFSALFLAPEAASHHFRLQKAHQKVGCVIMFRHFLRKGILYRETGQKWQSEIDSIVELAFDAGGVPLCGCTYFGEERIMNDPGSPDIINPVFHFALDLLYLLNVVSNVGYERIAPAARVPKHEYVYPRFEYRVLRIRRPRGAMSPRLKEQLRKSPRQHLRRGHLRHYKDGDVVWISPCIIGDAERGTIVHDYIL